jgi:hypothetical protein
MRTTLSILGWLLLLFPLCVAAEEAAPEKSATVDYDQQVAPLLRKYCAGCHNTDDPAGKLALDSFDLLMKGGEHGAPISPGSSDSSRMIRLLTGKADPKMPPADEAQPSPAEIELLKLWIDQGAKGPSGKTVDLADLPVPKIAVSSSQPATVNHLAISPDGKLVALARYGEVELRSWPELAEVSRLKGIRGAVNSIEFSKSGEHLVAAGGEPGITGQAVIWKVATGEVVRSLRGHRDAMLGARYSHNQKMIATCSYDQTIIIWDLETGNQLKALDGHNGAVYEVAFRPDDQVLASASGDRTVKLWSVGTGERLDTLSQSTKELYCLAWDPSGTRLIAAGVDNRIRQWQITANAAEGTNPILVSQFAHEMALLRVAYSRDGKLVVSTGEDSRAKVWNAADLSPIGTLAIQPDWVTGAAFSPDGGQVVLARRDGSVVSYSASVADASTQDIAQSLPDFPMSVDYGPQPEQSTLTKIAEAEPNNEPAQATPLTAPIIATGTIHADNGADSDLFRFSAKTGDQWIVETRSDAKASMVDTKVEILDVAGKAVPRLLLRAVRDTEVEFRSMNSEQRGVRLKNWEEMLLNEFVYLNGDVIKHYRQRRGPDADGDFYPEGGLRHAFFDTTPRAHALAEPGYVVVPYPIGTTFSDNGLPIFTLNYENDDDGLRKLGRNSKLTFVAPADGDYLVRVSDVRGSSSPQHTYELVIRRPEPAFTASVGGAAGAINAGGGKTLSFRVDRVDNFMGPVRLEIENLPPGFSVSNNVVVQEGLYEAFGVIHASPYAVPLEKGWDKLKITAVATVAGKEVRRDVAGVGQIMLAERSKVVPYMELIDQQPREYSAPAPRTFAPITVWSAAALGGATLKMNDDASILAAGENADSETYVVVASPANTAPITALRLEVMGDDSLPAKSPGRADGNGNFVLTELRITAAPKGKPAMAKPVKIAAAFADYSQDGFSGANLIDGNPDTGWAIASNGPNNTFPVKRDQAGSPNHSVVFELAEPLAIEAGSLLTVHMEHSLKFERHNVGRFRISATSDIRADVPPAPAMQEIVIAPGGSATLKLRVDRHGFNDRIAFDVQNLPHGIIVEDIGLSGVLVRENETERTIFVRAEPWVPEQSRPFFAQANAEGNQCTRPVMLHVRRSTIAASDATK